VTSGGRVLTGFSRPLTGLTQVFDAFHTAGIESGFHTARRRL